jgi:hypothetical protein
MLSFGWDVPEQSRIMLHSKPILQEQEVVEEGRLDTVAFAVAVLVARERHWREDSLAAPAIERMTLLLAFAGDSLMKDSNIPGHNS